MRDMNLFLKIFFGILFFLSFIGYGDRVFSAQEESAYNAPKELAAEGNWNMGRIKQGAMSEKVFCLVNNSNGPVSMKSINSCCGYDAELSDWEIDEGEKAKVRVTLNAGGKRPGKDVKYLIFKYESGGELSSMKVPVESFIIENRQLREEAPGITASRLRDLIEDEWEILLIDVREKDEFAEAHIPGALNLPRSEYDMTEDVPSSLRASYSPETIAVVYCGGGFRSGYVTGKLRTKGYDAFDLEGGLQAWKGKGYPTEKGIDQPPSPGPIHIGLEEAYQYYYIKFGDHTVWVDLRSKKKYKEAHIDGAVNVPYDLLTDRYDLLPRDKNLVLYSGDGKKGKAKEASIMLAGEGFKKGSIRVLTEGFKGWVEAGYPLETAGQG